MRILLCCGTKPILLHSTGLWTDPMPTFLGNEQEIICSDMRFGKQINEFSFGGRPFETIFKRVPQSRCTNGD